MKPSKDDERNEDGTEAVLVSEVIPATRERIFTAWLNSEQHSAFTGEPAVIEPVVGGKHSSLGGYATGTTLALDPYRRIVQSWQPRTFPAGSGPSTVEITLEETVGGTLLTLLHSEIPQGQSDHCREAWLTSYLEPLKRYFTGRLSNGVHEADTKALRRKRKPRSSGKGPARPAQKSARRAPKRTATAAKSKAKAKVKAHAAGKPLRRAAAKRVKRTGMTAPDKRRSARSAAAKASKKPVRKRAGSKSRPAKRPRSR